MKPFHKVLAALLAVILVASLASCAPITLTKEWSYKYDKDQYDIGVYIYALQSAYLKASVYAKDAKGYKEDESFLDLTIKDSDGNKAVARDWILEKAKETALNFVAVTKLFDKKGATYDEAAMTSAKEFTKNTWDVGLGASQGQYNPFSGIYEDYGVSYDSFKQIFMLGDLEDQYDSYMFDTYTPIGLKKDGLFNKLYGEDGEQEVSDKELEKFFKANYADYSIIPVKLYESTTDDQGNSSNKKLSSKKAQKIKDVVKGYVDEINNGSASFDDIFKKAEKKYGVTDSDKQENKVDALSDLKESNKDVYNKLKDLKEGKAAFVVTNANGDDTAPTAYIIVMNNVNKDVENYVKGASRSAVLHKMKDDAFDDYLNKESKALDKDSKFESNDGAINAYSPDIFYEKPEEETESTSSEAQ